MLAHHTQHASWLALTCGCLCHVPTCHVLELCPGEQGVQGVAELVQQRLHLPVPIEGSPPPQHHTRHTGTYDASAPSQTASNDSRRAPDHYQRPLIISTPTAPPPPQPSCLILLLLSGGYVREQDVLSPSPSMATRREVADERHHRKLVAGRPQGLAPVTHRELT